jgi:hypothetical protein
MYGVEYGPWMYGAILYIIILVYMSTHLNILFDLRIVDMLLLYYYYSQALDKYKYYILCTFLYLARELNEPARS